MILLVAFLLFALLIPVVFVLGWLLSRADMRRSREVVIREVEKIVPTEKVVTVEKPVYIQIPAPQPAPQPKQPSGGSLPVMGANRHTVITDPAERAAAEGMTQLLNILPE